MITFKELGLSENILKAIDELGFVNPTPIQEKSIPELINNKSDLVALAQTGTGKTAAFGLPVLERIDISNNKVQALMLCPTRELALQISRDLENFSKHMKGLHVTSVYGGADIQKQIKELRRGTHIVVGTPGRVNDLTKRGILKLANLEYLVLDEADEMLNMGFKEELDSIIGNTPDSRQSLLFSATMPKEIASMAKRYLTDPVELKVGKTNSGANTVDHQYYMVHAKDRYLALKRLADIHPDIYGIVFCRTRYETKEVAEKLMSDGYSADALHGDLSQAQRDQVMHRFRNKNIQILVATDVAARGIDVNELTHVINYNLPDDIEAYTHRSGRTGRAGKTGTSIAIIHTKESSKIREIERISGIKFTKKLIPSGEEICQRQLFHLVDRVENVEVNHEQVDSFLPSIFEKLEGFDREELIKRFVSVEFNRFIAYYEGAKDLNVYRKERDDFGGGRSNRRDRGDRGNFARMYINVGKAKNLTAPRLMGIVNEYSGKNKIGFGKIEILRNFSFFEVDEGNKSDIISALKGKAFEGETLHVEQASAKPSGGGGGGRKGGGNYGNGGGNRRRSDKRRR
ncbi:DEAD/DEAH box helicase [Saccharicrinis aurantiacus]|uniref:DEAD/DEAH box helicase n=1 Tax=Saccharicrinis aurantiacus TaxID=1849719 RepID=UPI000838460D|nr:DEAD/DEAH box helicase [Saccharicrinis aurantiacus]